MTTLSTVRSGVALLAVAVSFADSARAQEAIPGTTQAPNAERPASAIGVLEEVTVTAQRRTEDLQNVPISITALSEAALVSAGISSSQQLPVLVPGLIFANNGNTLEPFLRGVGNNNNAPGNELPVTLYIDNVYVASANSNLMDLYDVDNIAVLKGPQGTLFGRNSVGGVIQIFTKSPVAGQELNAEYGVSLDNFETIKVDFFASDSLSPRVAASITGVYSRQGEGWGENEFSGQDVHKIDKNISLRSKFVFTPSDSTTVTLGLDYTNREDSLSANFVPYSTDSLVLPGFVPQSNPWDTYSNEVTTYEFEGGGGHVTVDHDLGFAKFVSISAYHTEELDFANFDIDGSPTPGWRARFPEPVNSFSQEFQLNSSSSERLQWTAGLFYFNQVAKVDDGYLNILPAFQEHFGLPPFDTLIAIDSRQEAESLAGYAQMTAEILQDTNLTLGARYTDEERTFDATQGVLINGTLVVETEFPGELSFGEATWRVALDHSFTSDVLGYVSYNTGFKSGGFNTIDPSNPPYLPESLDAYEIGLKTELLDNRVRLNSALFYYDRTNVQVNRYVGNNQAIFNGAGATIKGLDVDFVASVSEGLTLSAGFVWLESEFTSFPNAIFYSLDPVTGDPVAFEASAKGKELPFAPTFSGNVGIDYGVNSPIGKLDFNVTNAYSSGYVTEPDNRLSQPSYNFLSASIRRTSESGRWSILLWGRNLLDEEVAGQLITSSNWGFMTDLSNPPRIYGITLNGSF